MPTVCIHRGVQTQAWFLLSLSIAVLLASWPFTEWSDAQDPITKGLVREERLCFLCFLAQCKAVGVGAAGVSDTQGSLLKRSLWQLSEEHAWWWPQASQVRRSAGSSFGGLDQVMEPAGIWERSSRACGRNNDEERVQ